MPNKRAYDVSAIWDDPFEHRDEQRQADRFKAKLSFSVTVDHPEQKGRLVGPAVVQNMSLSGACVATKHRLTPSQKITIAIPTDICRDSLCLPEAFVGDATVLRIEPIDEKQSRVALCFSDDLSGNMEFAMFVDFLQSVSRVMITPV